MDKIDDFLAKLKEMNCNKTSGDMDYDELFGKDAPFAIVCNKCGSMDIEIIGEDEGSRVILLHGYWELSGQDFIFRDRDIVLNESIFGKITIRGRR